MPKITIGTTKFGETLDRGTGRPIEEPYWVPSTFARQEVINPVTNGAATVCINVAVAVTREVNLN